MGDSVSSEEWKTYVAGKLRELETGLKVNTEATQSNAKNTEKMLEIFSTFEGGMKFLGWLGVAGKWLISVAGGVAIVWAIVLTLIKGKISGQ